MRDSDRIAVHCLAGASYGTGTALVADELPMLIDFRDVYWTPEGRRAVDLAPSVIAAGGAYFTGLPPWRGVTLELATTGQADSADSR
jgi:hypothetical protein